jgi:SAM-dependent methyltransferase
VGIWSRREVTLSAKALDPTGRNKRFQFFWESAGESIPPFLRAPSTRYYLECEQHLFERYFPPLAGKRLLKTDVWDEAKNTRILLWAARDKGVQPFGLDISSAIVRQARQSFVESGVRGRFIVSDMRDMGYLDETFDCLYSMGTCEHFPEYRTALAECFRVLKPGGTAIIGVPNKHDPFLRPLQVAALNALGLYAYGYEKSFTIRTLEDMLRDIGFQPRARTGILFMPGALRMLDLFLYVNWPGTARVTDPLVRPFAWLYRRFDGLKRMGYLVVSVVRKPGRPGD